MPHFPFTKNTPKPDKAQRQALKDEAWKKTLAERKPIPLVDQTTGEPLMPLDKKSQVYKDNKKEFMKNYKEVLGQWKDEQTGASATQAQQDGAPDTPPDDTTLECPADRPPCCIESMSVKCSHDNQDKQTAVPPDERGSPGAQKKPKTTVDIRQGSHTWTTTAVGPYAGQGRRQYEMVLPVDRTPENVATLPANEQASPAVYKVLACDTRGSKTQGDMGDEVAVTLVKTKDCTADPVRTSSIQLTARASEKLFSDGVPRNPTIERLAWRETCQALGPDFVNPSNEPHWPLDKSMDVFKHHSSIFEYFYQRRQCDLAEANPDTAPDEEVWPWPLICVRGPGGETVECYGEGGIQGGQPYRGGSVLKFPAYAIRSDAIGNNPFRWILWNRIQPRKYGVYTACCDGRKRLTALVEAYPDIRWEVNVQLNLGTVSGHLGSDGYQLPVDAEGESVGGAEKVEHLNPDHVVYDASEQHKAIKEAPGAGKNWSGSATLQYGSRVYNYTAPFMNDAKSFCDYIKWGLEFFDICEKLFSGAISTASTGINLTVQYPVLGLYVAGEPVERAEDGDLDYAFKLGFWARPLFGATISTNIITLIARGAPPIGPVVAAAMDIAAKGVGKRGALYARVDLGIYLIVDGRIDALFEWSKQFGSGDWEVYGLGDVRVEFKIEGRAEAEIDVWKVSAGAGVKLGAKTAVGMAAKAGYDGRDTHHGCYIGGQLRWEGLTIYYVAFARAGFRVFSAPGALKKEKTKAKAWQMLKPRFCPNIPHNERDPDPGAQGPVADQDAVDLPRIEPFG